MKKEELIKQIKALTSPGNETWNHQYCFLSDIKTRSEDIDSPGYNLNKWKRLKPIILDLKPKGKTFLDIGCSDGFYSIEIAKIGAKNVLGTDLDSLRIKRANLAKKALKIDNADFKELNLYDTPNTKKYDVVVGLGLLHRIPDMLQCLKKMCNISNAVLVEFKTLKADGDTFINHGGKTKSNKYNGLYVTPTIDYVKNRFCELGFSKIKVYEDDSNLNYPRTIIVAQRG